MHVRTKEKGIQADTIFMRWLVILGVLLVLLTSGEAQAATYAYRSDTFAYDTPSGAATSLTWHASGAAPGCTSYPNGDDDWADVAFPSGFTFTFGGVNYSSVRVYSNGILAFGTDVSGFHREYTPRALPINAAGPALAGCVNAVPTKLMIGYWVDIIAGSASGITNAAVKSELLTDGLGQKRFVITWDNVALYGDASTRYSFQIALYASLSGVNGNFRYQYTTGSTTGVGAAVGVQLSTTDYTQFAYNQNFIDTAVGTAILWYPANQLAAKSAEYRFDEGLWLGTAGEVKDTSGSSQHATKVGLSSNIAGGKLCRGGSFTGNTLNLTVDAVATPIVPANRGSVSFWFKSTTAWNSADAMLFDATTVAARPFFLMKRSNGALRFAVTDSGGTVRTAETTTGYTYGANTWHHIAVSWSFTPGTNQTVQQIILDGVLVNTSGTTPFRTTSTGAIATPSTLYIGDNRTSGITPSTGTPNGANGTIDEVYIYAIDINATQAAADMALTRPLCTTLDHFHIVHTGEQVSCGGAVANITVEAHDASHGLISLAGTTMQMSTSTGHGNWSGVSTINPVVNSGSGNGSYTFSGESSIVLGLSNSTVESLNINLNSGGVTESSGAASSCVAQDYTLGSTCDANLNFVQAGYLFDVPNHVSEVSQSVTVKAVKKSDNSAACVSAYANTSRNLTFTCAYTNPTTGTLPVRVGGKALNTSNSTVTACDATGQAVNLSFNASGVATTTVQYADVGRVTLAAQDTTAGITMTGSDVFVAAPASFAFSAITAAPIRAGVNFSATVSAKNSAGATTPNFGKETAAESVVLAFAKVSPTGTGAVNGAFTGSVGAFNSGSSTSNALNWTEVGTIDITAALTSGSYLASGLTATGTTGPGGNVGRFVPDHFDTVVTQGCAAGAYSYSAQPFAVQVVARNRAGATTANYDGSANTNPNFSKAVTFSDANALPGGALAPTAVAANTFVAGASAAAPAFTFATRTTAPGAIRLRALDADNVSSATGNDGTAATALEGVTTIRSGRARLSNALGSDRLDLPMTFRAEYWVSAASGWVLNSQDSCTNATLAFAPVAGAPNIVGNTCVIEPGNNSGAGCAAAPTVANRRYLETGVVGTDSNGVAGFAGNFNLWLRAPGAGNVGSIDVTANIPAWLQFNWTGAVGNPVGRATFGVYRSPLIYRRENY
ncbi:MSHA biogenesis protein MshQ [Rhodoferax saidenbachensis]|uniref:MSHA biogenesis protein MshQ n=2 Tax=Rhodoferax saidenbachensis TaxID=1484693 RepID=A0ABU1ZN39_9BURK|nr:MSHA biogenesis protein MshQ [Rhodoferax saidenbachensis]